jgi:hypothetical protein
MTFNIKRLGALAAAQCAAFVVVLLFGILGSPGHHTPSVVVTPPAVQKTASVPPARTVLPTDSFTDPFTPTWGQWP